MTDLRVTETWVDVIVRNPNAPAIVTEVWVETLVDVDYGWWDMGLLDDPPEL